MPSHKGQGVLWKFPVLDGATKSGEVNEDIFSMQAQI